MAKRKNNRWLTFGVFFAFMLLHQSDKLLIGPLTTPIMETFNINEAQMGAVSTVALIVGAVFYPLWGYLYDRFSRAKLLALASFIWGSTTWLNAIAPNFSTFLITRATTGIDDSSYPGIYSMVSDLFEPEKRGKVNGLLQISQPLGYLGGMVLALMLGAKIGWRSVFYITGSLGVVIAAIIFFTVKEPVRGQAEPEMADLDAAELATFKFEWSKAKELFKKPTMIIMFLQGFFGVFPWQVITFWIFRYLEVERGYAENEILVTMVITILFLSAGYFLGGSVGDWAFKKTRRGRLYVGATGVLLGAIFLAIAISTPVENRLLFGIALSLTGLFMPIASPNVISTVHDVTLPEVRSTALAIQYFIENAGAALAPLLAGLIAVRADLKTALLLICITTWVLCAIFYFIASRTVTKDIETLRGQMRERAEA